MERLKSGFLGVFFILGGLFLLSGCASSEESKLADLFQDNQMYYLSTSPLDDPIISIEKFSDGKIVASRIDAGISEEMTYSVENKEKGLYQYHIVNDEGRSIFKVSNFDSDTTDFNVFYDEEHKGYAFVSISQNYSKLDSTLEEVKAIYDHDPMYFVGLYQE